MELILISKSKLKIMLDENDMKKYNIGERSDCAQTETRKAIRSILDRARDQIGFDTEGSEIFVQLYTSKSGGCELFVTKGSCTESYNYSDGTSDSARPNDKRLKKRDSSSAKSEGNDSISNAVSPYLHSLSKVQAGDFGRLAFSFTSLADIISVCKLLSRKCFSGKSDAFGDESGQFYLILTEVNTKAYSRLDDLTFILEFGQKEKVDALFTYLYEHGKTICRNNAVETLSNF